MAELTPDAASRHVPVLLQRCLDLLGPALSEPGAVMVDSTLGMGGHTEGVLAAFPHVRVVGLDRDPQALELAGRRLAPGGAHPLSTLASSSRAFCQSRCTVRSVTPCQAAISASDRPPK